MQLCIFQCKPLLPAYVSHLCFTGMVLKSLISGDWNLMKKNFVSVRFALWHWSRPHFLLTVIKSHIGRCLFTVKVHQSVSHRWEWVSFKSWLTSWSEITQFYGEQIFTHNGLRCVIRQSAPLTSRPDIHKLTCQCESYSGVRKFGKPFNLHGFPV